jgi:hypothetical protein
VICFAAGEPLTEGTTALAGGILSFRILGTFIVVLNSIKANKDLREGRSENYSERSRIPILEM